MAEFCLECWNRINGSNDSKRKYILSKDLDFCEGCGEYKSVIVMERRGYYLYKLRFLTFPFKIIFVVVIFLWRLLTLPYWLFKYKE